jgi:hypothetical protein
MAELFEGSLDLAGGRSKCDKLCGLACLTVDMWSALVDRYVFSVPSSPQGCSSCPIGKVWNC